MADVRVKIEFCVPSEVEIDQAMKPLYDAAEELTKLGLSMDVTISSIGKPFGLGKPSHWNEEGNRG